MTLEGGRSTAELLVDGHEILRPRRRVLFTSYQ